jgi:hypothetical protein
MTKNTHGRYPGDERERAEEREREQNRARAQFLSQLIRSTEAEERGTFTQREGNDGNKG